MAFALKIKSKGLFAKKKIDFTTLLNNCKLKYGSANDFYILEENILNNETAILYNPNRIGRGIFYDGSKVAEGIIEISYNIPTTETEINDFINIAIEVNKQFKNAEMYCVEEERAYTVKELIDNKERMVKFSLESLNNFCSNKEYKSYILTLAMWPIYLKKEQVELFSVCLDLKEFEQILHDVQCMDVYYAKPRLMQNKEGKIGAFYTLTEECESIFPVKADILINLNNIKIDDAFISFYIYSENRMRDGIFSYEKFIKYMLDKGANYFDEEHIYIPSLIKQEIENIVERIS